MTLAIGIAATASLFSVVNGMLRDPLPYPEPGRLASVWRKELTPVSSLRPLALMMPWVTVCSSPRGLPMATTHSPMRSPSESPSLA